MKKLLMICATAIMLFSAEAFSQDVTDLGRFTGNFQIDAQTYQKDEEIGAKDVPDEKLLSNSFFNLIYNLGGFEVGMRYENYSNPIAGFDSRYTGSGISYRYLTYRSDFIDVTAGDFYEQFGSGLIFRSYEERALGIDNAMDGLRVKLYPTEGIHVTGIIGKQRNFWNKGEGIVRGADLSVNLTSVFESMLPSDYSLEFGLSAVSKYQDSSSFTHYLPPNTCAVSGRMALTTSFFMLDAEYAQKNNDPNASNSYNYNPGKGFITNASFFGDGYGISFNYHYVDNMDFRSDRDGVQNELLMSYIPPATKQHAWRLGTFYPYSTQLNGEVGFQVEATYKIPKKSLLGGKYGTDIVINYSMLNSIDTTHTMMDTLRNQALEYDASMFAFGDDNYYRDFSIDISRKFSKQLKAKLGYIYTMSNRDVLEGGGAPKYGKADANILIGEVLYKFNRNYSLRTEVQHMWASQDSLFSDGDYTYGNWMLALAELTIAPNWFITVWDEFNYFEEDHEIQVDVDGEMQNQTVTIDRSLHYPNISIAYTHHSTRIQATYGKTRQGILCVGGVCRLVPSSNGLYLSITSSF